MRKQCVFTVSPCKEDFVVAKSNTRLIQLEILLSVKEPFTSCDKNPKDFCLLITAKDASSLMLEIKTENTSNQIANSSHGTLSIDDEGKSCVKFQNLNSIDEQQKVKPQTASEVTLGEVLLRYLEVRTLRPRTRHAYRSVSQQRLGDWLSLPVTRITKKMVEERHHYISNVGGDWKPSKVQANFAMMILKLLLNFAADQYETKEGLPLLRSNPVNTLSKNRLWHRMTPRQNIISDYRYPQWFKAVMSLKNTKVRDFLLLVVFTGLRKSEAMTLQWTDVDFESRILTVRADTSKNHKEHRLPLSTFLFNLLKKRKIESRSEFVFPGRQKHLVQISSIIEQVKKSAGFNFSTHDLRRSFLTLAERLDLPYYVLKRLANHSGGSDVTFTHYIVADVERLREPMEKITRRMLELMNCPP